VAFLAFTRLLLVGLHVWIAVHVPLVRKSIFFCESLSSLAWMPIMAVLLHKTSSPSERDSYTEGSLAIMLVMATLLDIVAVHGPAIFRKSVPKPFRGQIEKFIPAVPLNIAYAEARNERLIIIGIGTVIAEGLRQLNNARETITVDQEFTVYVAVPLTVFLIKVYFFDLSPHFGDTSKNTHAMRVSRRRGLAFNLLHVPTFGAIIWISSALGGLIAQGAANTARWEVEVSFSAAVLTYLLCVTGLHMLHKGAGHGLRKMGKSRRMLMRFAMMLTLCGWTAFAAVTDMRPLFFAGAACVLVTIEACVELWGRGFAILDDGVTPKALADEESGEGADANALATYDNPDEDEGGAASANNRFSVIGALQGTVGGMSSALSRGRLGRSGQRAVEEPSVRTTFSGLTSGRVVSSKFPVEIARFHDDI